MKTFKKFGVLVAIAVTTVFSSCSTESDSAASVNASGPLPSKVVYTRSGFVQTNNYTYSGNKILELNTPESDIRKVKYTYTGDDITKIEIFAVGLTAGSLQPYGGYTMTYENGKLKTKTNLPFPGSTNALSKETRVYNADGTVNISYSTVNQTTNVETPTTGVSGRLTYTNGFLTKRETTYSGSATAVTNYTIAQGKNAAFKNVLGYSEFAIYGNLITNEEIIGNPTVNNAFTYTFNAQNYPTKVVYYNAISIDITY